MNIYPFVSRLKSASFLRLTLINMGLLDELLTGFPTVGLPLVHEQLGLSYEQIGLLFSIGAIVSAVIEPPMFLLADRGSKRPWVIGGFVVLVLAFLLAGSVPTFFVLALSFALFYPAVGAAVSLSQAVLIDLAPQQSARTMTRWTLLSGIGDLLSPLAVTTILSLGLGWRGLSWTAAAIWLVAALIVAMQRFPKPLTSYSHKYGEADISKAQLVEEPVEQPEEPTEEADEVTLSESTEERVGLLQNLRQGLRDTVLLRWAALSIFTAMLDEVFLAFAVLYLRDVLHADELAIGLIIAAQMLAGLLSLFVLERLLGRVAPVRLLTLAASLALLGMIGLLAIHALWCAALSLIVISFGASCLYPIVESEAYNRQPGRSGMVQAIIQLGAPFEIVLPGIVGLLAARFGLLASLGFLGSAPLLFLLLAPRKSA
ncbi:MAG TPA: MFS transporter [Ktedonobacteraceae bacterium]|nr:MFS transporter [Ktedonobacteraceae bacterium]